MRIAAMDASATVNDTTVGGTLTMGKGITDVLEIGVNTSNVVGTNGTLNLTGLNQFTANVDTVRLGIAAAGFTGKGTLNLAVNNDLTAGTSILIGNSGGAANNGVTSIVLFGSGQNNVTTRTLTFGGNKSIASATVAAGGTVNLAGFGANTLDFLVGAYDTTGTAGSTSSFNLTGGTLLASLNNWNIAQKINGSSGGISGIVTLTGTANAINASNVTIGNVTGNNLAGATATNGTLNFGGGTFVVNNNLALATWSANTVGTPTTTGILNLTGGTFTIAGNITRTTTDEARSNSFVNVSGGTLDLQNQAAGDPTPGTLTASQLAFRSGTLTDIASATLAATTATSSGVAGTVGDALILRDTSIPFAVTFTGATGGHIHYEAASGGTGGVISGALDLGGVARTVNVEDSAGAADDLTITGAITNAAPAVVKTGAGKLLLDTVVGTRTTIFNAKVGETHFAQNQTLAALIIDDGASVTFGDVPPFLVAPAFHDASLPPPASAVPESGALGLLRRRPPAQRRRCGSSLPTLKSFHL